MPQDPQHLRNAGAAERLKRAGLLESLVDDERGYESWRVSEAALATAANGTDASRGG
jgi:hypothetical protein